jgi:hypothetical protein
MKTDALALMEAASFCAGVRHKRYSGQQETAPQNILVKTENCVILQNGSTTRRTHTPSKTRRLY